MMIAALGHERLYFANIHVLFLLTQREGRWCSGEEDITAISEYFDTKIDLVWTVCCFFFFLLMMVVVVVCV